MRLRDPKKCVRADAIVCAGVPRRELSFRAKRQIAGLVFLAVALGMGLAAMYLGGCTSAGTRDDELTAALDAPVNVSGQRPAAGNQGRSWQVVFPSLPLVIWNSGIDPADQPEYGRNDAAMNYRPNGPLLATAEWPEAPRADLAFQRRITLETQPDQLLYFERSTEGGSPNYRLYRNGYGVGWPGYQR